MNQRNSGINRKSTVTDFFKLKHLQLNRRNTDQSRFSTTTNPLSSVELKNVEEAFAKFDANGDGWVDALELRQAMKSFGFNPTEKAVFKLMEAFDTNGDGNINFDEFLKMVKPDTGDYIVDVRVALGAFKSEQNVDFTDLSELEEVLLSYTDENEREVKAMICDLKNSGGITERSDYSEANWTANPYENTQVSDQQVLDTIFCKEVESKGMTMQELEAPTNVFQSLRRGKFSRTKKASEVKQEKLNKYLTIFGQSDVEEKYKKPKKKFNKRLF